MVAHVFFNGLGMVGSTIWNDRVEMSGSQWNSHYHCQCPEVSDLHIVDQYYYPVVNWIIKFLQASVQLGWSHVPQLVFFVIQKADRNNDVLGASRLHPSKMAQPLKMSRLGWRRRMGKCPGGIENQIFHFFLTRIAFILEGHTTNFHF